MLLCTASHRVPARAATAAVTRPPAPRRSAVRGLRTLSRAPSCLQWVAPAVATFGPWRGLSETPVPPHGSSSTASSLQDRLRDAAHGVGGGSGDNRLSTAIVALGLVGGAYWYYRRVGAPPVTPPLEAAAAPFTKTKEVAEDIANVVEEQVGAYGVDLTMDRLDYEMQAALKRFASAAGALHRADLAEAAAALERDRAQVRQEYEAAAVRIQTDYARAMTSASRKDDPELVQLAMEHARSQRDAHLQYIEELRDYRLKHAKNVHDACAEAAKKCKAARDATKSNMDLALQKLVKAQRDAQSKFDADMADANSMVEQAKEDAMAMANTYKYNALSKALVLKEQAEDAARRAEENAIAKAYRTRDSLIAASESSVKKFIDAQDDYRDSLLAAYAEVAEQKEQLAKASLLGKADQAYLEAMKLADDTKTAALNKAEQARQASLDGLETLWQEAVDKASSVEGDDASYSQLGGIMSSLYTLKSAAVDEVKRDTKAVLSKLGAEKKQIAKWYRDSVNTAIAEYKKDTAAIQDKYNKAVKEATDKKGAAKEKALVAIQEQKDTELARAEKVMKDAKDAATKSREYSDKQIAEMEAYFMDLDNP